MRKQADTVPTPVDIEDMLMEIVEYATLLDDMTIRSVNEGMALTADGLNGLNRLAAHMHGLALEALGNVPTRQEGQNVQ